MAAFKKKKKCFWCIFGKSSWDVFPRAWNYYVIFRSYLEILKLSLFERAYLKHVVGYSNWKLEAWDHTLTCFNILTYVPSLNESHCKFTALSADYDFFLLRFLQRSFFNWSKGVVTIFCFYFKYITTNCNYLLAAGGKIL